MGQVDSATEEHLLDFAGRSALAIDGVACRVVPAHSPCDDEGGVRDDLPVVGRVGLQRGPTCGQSGALGFSTPEKATHRLDDLAEPDLDRRVRAASGGVRRRCPLLALPLPLPLTFPALAVSLVIARVVLLRVEEAVVLVFVLTVGGTVSSRIGSAGNARVVDQLGEFALSHLVRSESEDEQERIDRVRLAGPIRTDDRREGLKEAQSALA